LTPSERQEVFKAFGPRKSMQVYDRGLRRRVPPMLDGDQDRIRLIYSLMFSLPGTPVLFYGEEIGMGENLAAEQRLAVRTPMQWNAGKNGGFSTAATADLIAPMVRGTFGPRNVNVDAQRPDPDSLHSFMRSLMRVYRECPELGWGTFTLLKCEQASVLAHQCAWEDRTTVLLHNLADRAVTAKVALPEGRGPVHLAEPLGQATVDTDRHGSFEVRLPRYGRLWLRVLP
ncbi:MAG: hypothetical protein LH461_04535, partial [Spirochaetaceae bacterium]|nr:hypothetical protein [Spirochaetaceae bacterium]